MLYDFEFIIIVYYVNQVMCVYKLFQCDQYYIVCDDEIVLIDEFIGCMMKGCCLFDGLYQVIEVKEGVMIQFENVMLVLVIFQNYFWFYVKFGGMIGIVVIEVEEFVEIYKLGVVEVLMNCLIQCIDEYDCVYCIVIEKYVVVIEVIKEVYVKGQLIFVGMISIEKLEMLLQMMM